MPKIRLGPTAKTATSFYTFMSKNATVPGILAARLSDIKKRPVIQSPSITLGCVCKSFSILKLMPNKKRKKKKKIIRLPSAFSLH